MGVLVAFVAGPAPAEAGTLDQSQTNSGASLGFGGQRLAGQTFTAGPSGYLDQVDVNVRRFVPGGGSSCNYGTGITVSLRSVAGGVPGDTVLAGALVPTASITTSFGWVSVPLPAPGYPVAAGGQYALVLSAPDASCGGVGYLPYEWAGAGSNPYPAGASYARGGASAWMLQGAYDLMFRTFVATPPPGETPPPGDEQPPQDPAPDPGTPGATETARTLSVNYSVKREAFRGRITSSLASCVAAQEVSLHKIRRRGDVELGAVKTKGDGKYSIEEGRPGGRYYTTVEENPLDGATCAAVRSETIRVIRVSRSG